jgi:hypothetical protein
MSERNFINLFLFVIFFSIGAASLGVSVLCEDLVEYYQNRQLLKSARESLERLKLITNDYDVLLSQLENDPNLVKRIARATLGSGSDDPNTVYPAESMELLADVRRVLNSDVNQPDEQPDKPKIPGWLARSSEPKRRIALFFSGVVLILISLICFRPILPSMDKEK